jgi:hypothetical protein
VIHLVLSIICDKISPLSRDLGNQPLCPYKRTVTTQRDFAYRAVLLSGPARLPYKQRALFYRNGQVTQMVTLTAAMRHFQGKVLALFPLDNFQSLTWPQISKFHIYRHEITFGQWTMSGQNAELSGQILTLPVILTGLFM